jgi:hypothetical protein
MSRRVTLGARSAKKRGKKIATIAIARKLLTRAWHLLADMQATGPATRLRAARPVPARPGHLPDAEVHWPALLDPGALSGALHT